MSIRKTPQRPGDGFTLVEILVALAILGTGVVMLIESHYAALRLFSNADEEALMQNLLARALGQAEHEVLAGTLEGSGDFGKRFPEYSYSFSSDPLEEDIPIRYFEVTAKVNGPIDSREMSVLVMDVVPR